ncbi:YitT family protein [Thermodesulfobacteriota bacterium]
MKSKIKYISLIIWNLILICVGSALCAIAINGILVPHEFLGAGFTGIAILMHYMIPAIPVSLLYFVLNIPVYSIGWIHVGRRFFFYSIPGMLIFSAALQWVQIPLPIHDRMLGAILAGIITGGGSGIILKSLGSAGGLDILSVILMKRFSIRLGTTVLGFNILILAAGAVIISLEGALFTLIYIYVTSKIVDVVVTGLSQRKAVIIISSKWKEISTEINDKIHRGVTQLQGWGGYTGKEQRILYSVMTFRELAQFKQMINQVDPNAMVVVNDTLEVMGQRIGNQPHW